jgi:hypothetical protein
MPSKMAAQQIEVRRPPSAEDLRRVFETAMCELHPADFAAKNRHTPIVQRGRRSGMSQTDAEKRALSDAARALAQLWNV